MTPLSLDHVPAGRKACQDWRAGRRVDSPPGFGGRGRCRIEYCRGCRFVTSPHVDRSGGVQLATAVADVLARGWTTALRYADLTDLGWAALDAARHAFALPAERKAMFVDPSGAGNVGWRPASRGDRPDEVWQLDGGPDLWPAELEADRAAIYRLRTRCTEIVASLLEALAPALGLPPAELRRCVNTSESVVRLLHYSPRTNGIGFAPHTDLGLATFFAAESVPALELEDEAGQWRPADSDCAIAAGEMLVIRAGGRVPVGRHRVYSSAQERWSVAVFVHPEPTYVLGADDSGRPITAEGYFERALAVHVAGTEPRLGEQR